MFNVSVTFGDQGPPGNIGYDSRSGSNIPDGDCDPKVQNGTLIDFAFFHEVNNTFYFGESDNIDPDYGWGQQPMAINFPGFGSLKLDFFPGQGGFVEYWSAGNLSPDFKTYMQGIAGQTLDLLVEEYVVVPPPPATDIFNGPDSRFDGYPTDARFSAGGDTEHDGFPADGRFPTPGTDSRFS